MNAVARREAAAPAYLESVKECLKPIVEYAAEKNIRLGVEGRRGYEEIPSERELPALLDELNSPQLGYWHDIGHIQIKENLGFLNHEEWLRAIGPRTFGCHVQDCIWPAQDHQPPFAGDVDLEKLVPLLPANCLFVWEMSPRKTAEEIRRSVARLERTLRRMKKILLTLLQIAVTVAVLFWVFHDPAEARANGGRAADGRLPLDHRCAPRLLRGRVRRRRALADPAQGSADSPQHFARRGAVPDRDVLQSIPARWHRRRHHEKLSAC